eukprot:TRINITY_DN6245_c0_g1_i1.p1 TRINITY_DN6245_c0_g1~~TRINITY_DN6245_c0_g1_i1.p1  ORF type:complete len:458 (-),score=89.20 TRINITY_DN6245_c0_g1_i1:302-1675(-)
MCIRDRLYAARLAMNLKGLDQFLAPGDGDYFVRSIDPNGTLHGVIGAARHGYFEASPNHDAVALGVVNSSMAARIVSRIKSLGNQIRPNVFILPNTDATGKPSVSGAGGIGYDDMACGSGPTCGGIFEFGTWVNGGVWTTTEARWLMAAARTGDVNPAFESVRQMKRLYADTWRMDNPLVDFGKAPYQPDEDINLTVDNFGSAGGLLRGLFEYVYTSTTLCLVPHQPDNITSIDQGWGARWGPYRVFLKAHGVRSSGIGAVTINGVPLSPPHILNSSQLTLVFTAMPPASAAALASVNSTFRTAFTAVNISILYNQHPQFAPDRPGTHPFSNRSHQSAAPVFGCAELAAAHGLSVSQISKLEEFGAATSAEPELKSTLAHSMAGLALGYGYGFQNRCDGFNSGSIAQLRSWNASEASLVAMLSTQVSVYTGLVGHLNTTLARSVDPLAAKLRELWAS